MNFLQATRNRLAEARNNEGGFTFAEMLVSISLTAILIGIIFNTVGGTLLPAIVTPSLQHANNLDLKPAQVAANSLYKDIEAFTRANPDTAPSKSAMTAGGYVSQPSNVVWAFHTYGGPANPQRCVIAYLTDDTTDYSSSNPAAYDGLYQSGSVWQNCNRLTASGNTVVPNWDSE